ncbi:hypothetical protein HDU98_007850 [Podochytrium sp. JEL0797]|nr:hypothetical protein HDU98_007850 [Podochytrium sp. JEL0797]
MLRLVGVAPRALRLGLAPVRCASSSSALSRLLKRQAKSAVASVSRVRVAGSEAQVVLASSPSPSSSSTSSTDKNKAKTKAAPEDASSLRGEIARIHARLGDAEVLFTQVGGFYEAYEYALPNTLQLDALAALLDLHIGTAEPRRCGFPLASIDRYVARLVDNGFKVAIADQVSKDLMSQNKNFTRAITRIVTKGAPLLSAADDSPTATDSLRGNCFLLSLAVLPSENNENHRIGLSWTDITTGEFFVFESHESSLASDLARISPTEIVALPEHHLPASVRRIVLEKNQMDGTQLTFRAPNPEACLSHCARVQTRLDPMTAVKYSLKATDFTAQAMRLSESGKGASLKLLGQPATRVSLLAAGALFLYLDELFCGLEPHFNVHSGGVHAATRGGDEEDGLTNRSGIMHIDSASMTSLEIVKTIREQDKKGSLVSEMNQTKTSQGERLLVSRLKSPSTHLPEIHRRHALISSFHTLPTSSPSLATTQHHLTQIRDLERCLQRLHLRSAQPIHVMQLLQSLESCDAMRRDLLQLFAGASGDGEVREVVERLVPPMGLVEGYKTLFVRVVEQEREAAERGDVGGSEVGKLMKSRVWKAGTIGDGVSEQVDLWRRRKRECGGMVEALKGKLVGMYGVDVVLTEDKKDGPCILVKHNKNESVLMAVQGDRLVGGLVRQKHTNQTKFRHDEWTELFLKQKAIHEQEVQAEMKVFEEACQKIRNETQSIVTTSEAVAELDVAVSMAYLATKWGYCKPEIVDECVMELKGSRHPVVENMQLLRSNSFTSNDLFLDPTTRVWIITGPNMGGKSTFLRQVALIAIMAQAGLYVPATSARIGVFDAVFSRVGASDNLAANQSTFRVEMEETARILHRATPRSLMIMDEVGRGTSSQDGLAIACGVLERVLNVNRALCLFATHYHELPLVLGYQVGKEGGGGAGVEGVRCVKTAIQFLESGQFSYSYSLQDGVSESSYGIEAARVAGMPADVLQSASKLQRVLVEIRKRDEAELGKMLR